MAPGVVLGSGRICVTPEPFGVCTKFVSTKLRSLWKAWGRSGKEEGEEEEEKDGRRKRRIGG